MSKPYFHHFLSRPVPTFPALSNRQKWAWHLLAGVTIGFGLNYIYWRWSQSLNPDAIGFSVLVASLETFVLFGTLLFFYDIWDEPDSLGGGKCVPLPASKTKTQQDIKVDVFITTFDEETALVEPTILATKSLQPVPGVSVEIFVLDDGHRADMSKLAQRHGVGYFARKGNRGFKAGNLSNALMQTDGAFFVICDADTLLQPTFLKNTLGYFDDPKVSWVQTPHWFYDVASGQSWENACARWSGFLAKPVALVLRLLTGRTVAIKDHYLVDSAIFFDVIQRRRDRHNASFCCGAGSIHRREAVFENALREKANTLKSLQKIDFAGGGSALTSRTYLQLFKFHVSEDLFTSIQAHANGWKSVYHPNIEARMLSPWSAKAWAVQRLKYAGGTFDILLNANPLFKSGLHWTKKIHYLATFWSYVSSLVLLFLLLAPVVSLLTGLAPIKANSVTYFMHLLPVLIANELAMNATSKGYSHNAARILQVGTLFIQLRALCLVLRGCAPKFPATPKTPNRMTELRYSLPNIALLSVLLLSAVWGLACFFRGFEAYTATFLTMNIFWIFWAASALGRVIYATSIAPKLPVSS